MIIAVKKSILQSFPEIKIAKFYKIFCVRESLHPLNFFTIPFAYYWPWASAKLSMPNYCYVLFIENNNTQIHFLCKYTVSPRFNPFPSNNPPSNEPLCQSSLFTISPLPLNSPYDFNQIQIKGWNETIFE